MTGPLAGIRVLEVGHMLAGPFGGMMLADLGADVIKVEPLDGDLSRRVGSQTVGGHNVYFASLNRNKRSVHVDLTTDEGQAQLGELARTADALLVNLRPSTIKKLGLTYESLRLVKGFCPWCGAGTDTYWQHSSLRPAQPAAHGGASVRGARDRCGLPASDQ